jgi:hypothetical protein
MVGIMILSFPLVKTGDKIPLIAFHFSPVLVSRKIFFLRHLQSGK